MPLLEVRHLVKEFSSHQGFLTKPGVVRAVNAEHQRIMDAVLARDERKATRLMDAHLLATERAVSAMLQNIGA